MGRLKGGGWARPTGASPATAIRLSNRNALKQGSSLVRGGLGRPARVRRSGAGAKTTEGGFVERVEGVWGIGPKENNPPSLRVG